MNRADDDARFDAEEIEQRVENLEQRLRNLEQNMPAGIRAQDIVDIVQRDGKIAAIKYYREKTGVGLKEAKDAVDNICAEAGLQLRGQGCAAMIALWLAVGVALLC